MSPQPQYLRGPVRTRAARVLFALPKWSGVRIRGSEPSEIRSAEQLLSWVEAYGKVVEKLVEDLDDARSKVRRLSSWTLLGDNVGDVGAVHGPCQQVVDARLLSQLVAGVIAHECPREPEPERDPRERAAGES